MECEICGQESMIEVSGHNLCRRCAYKMFAMPLEGHSWMAPEENGAGRRAGDELEDFIDHGGRLS